MQTALPPEQIAWCGLDSVLLYWDEMLLMVGPNGDPVRYVYDEPIKLIPECDGVRILSNSTMEFLQRVPDSTVSIFQIGSTEPGALLYDALDHFDRHSAKVSPLLILKKWHLIVLSGFILSSCDSDMLYLSSTEYLEISLNACFPSSGVRIVNKENS